MVIAGVRSPKVSFSPPLPFSSLSPSLPFSSLRAPSLSPLHTAACPGGARPRPSPPARRRSSPPRSPARRRSSPPQPQRGARPCPSPSPRRRSPRPLLPPAAAVLGPDVVHPPPARSPAVALPPARWPGPPARFPAPAHGIPALGVARVASARPRAPPFTPNAFPRAQPHACGDYSWFLINFKLR
jgi:hypothetical protein